MNQGEGGLVGGEGLPSELTGQVQAGTEEDDAASDQHGDARGHRGPAFHLRNEVDEEAGRTHQYAQDDGPHQAR